MYIELTQDWLGHKKGCVLNLLDSVAHYLIDRKIAIMQDDKNLKEDRATIQDDDSLKEDISPSFKIRRKKDKMYRSYRNK